MTDIKAANHEKLDCPTSQSRFQPLPDCKRLLSPVVSCSRSPCRTHLLSLLSPGVVSRWQQNGSPEEPKLNLKQGGQNNIDTVCQYYRCCDHLSYVEVVYYITFYHMAMCYLLFVSGRRFVFFLLREYPYCWSRFVIYVSKCTQIINVDKFRLN